MSNQQTKTDTYFKQMSAVIGKMLSDLEEQPGVRDLHPMEFDKLRRRCIQGCWDAFATGRSAGINESKTNGLYSNEHTAEHSSLSS